MAMLATMFVLSSCGEDEDEDEDNDNNTCNCINNGQYTNTVDKTVKVDEKDVMANWVLVSSKEYMVSKGKTTLTKETDYRDQIAYDIFDGEKGIQATLYIYQGESGYDYYSTWKYDNGYIYIYSTYDVSQYAIISFSENEMILRQRTGDETTGAYHDQTFKKINGSMEDFVNENIDEKQGGYNMMEWN